MRIMLIASTAALALAGCSGADEAALEEEETGEIATSEDVSPAPADASDDIRAFLLQNYPDAAPGSYAVAWHDLNGDGADEAIVHLYSSYFCGSGGCNTFVLTPAGPMWSEVGNISVSRMPIGVADTSTNGWQDLTISVSGGGRESGVALLKFDGETYPSNPTVAPAEAAESIGTELLPAEPEMTPLEAEPASAE